MTSFLTLLADDPTLRLIQGGLLLLGIFIIFLLFFALRDILLRTHSFLYQIVCILLVALLPGVGFLVYLLIRPARTLKQRETDSAVKKTAALLEQVFAVEDPTSLDDELRGARGTEGTHSTGSGQAEGTEGTEEEDEALEELEELSIDEADDADKEDFPPR